MSGACVGAQISQVAATAPLEVVLAGVNRTVQLSGSMQAWAKKGN
jgi:hypothetical protein